MNEYYLWIPCNYSDKLAKFLRDCGIIARIKVGEGCDKFVFDNDKDLRSAEILWANIDDRVPVPAPSKCTLTVENSGPKIVQGLRNLTKGAWSIMGSNRIMWVYDDIKEMSTSKVAGCAIFYSNCNYCESPHNLIRWDDMKFEYLGDNLKIEFKV